jgi:hypothetical protein
VVDPALPRPGEESQAAGGTDLVARLRVLVRERDEQIADMLAAHGDGLPAVDAGAVPGTSEERRKRDEAWYQLDELLAELSAAERITSDLLDTPADIAVDRVRQRLHARNRLSISRSYQALARDGQLPDAELMEGWEVLTAIDPDLLDEENKALATYLRLWFAAERAARSADPTERDELISLARTAFSALSTQWPGSSFLISGERVLADVENRLGMNGPGPL